MTDVTTTTAPADDRIVCHIDGQLVHSIQLHIKKNYADSWTLERYVETYPDAPLMSPTAQLVVERRKAEAAAKEATSPGEIAAQPTGSALRIEVAQFHQLFDLGNAAAAMNARGEPIKVTTMEGHDDAALIYLPEVDGSYVFPIDTLKKIIVGFELGMNVYLWGMHGTGKTTLLQQAAARTKRPLIRVQHTINMQESDILGQWTVKDGATHFQLGPLPTAMINGWVYCADEYDFAMPSVLSVYQPVLEGQALLIKDAPPEYRKITPHPQFRMVGTGNTNGVGDETGLYQGTLIQNAANYSRWHITEEIGYMEAKIEENVVAAKTKAPRDAIQKMIRFATDVRQNFRDGNIGMTISPRELISGARLGIAFGGNFRMGLMLAFGNRLSRADRKVVDGYLDRIFGK